MVARRRRDDQDGGPIMKKLGMLGIIGGAAILTAVPLSLQWSQKTVALSLDRAEAREGRPLTATSGVSRRAYRRAVYGTAAGGYGYDRYSSPTSCATSLTASATSHLAATTPAPTPHRTATTGGRSKFSTEGARRADVAQRIHVCPHPTWTRPLISAVPPIATD